MTSPDSSLPVVFRRSDAARFRIVLQARSLGGDVHLTGCDGPPFEGVVAGGGDFARDFVDPRKARPECHQCGGEGAFLGGWCSACFGPNPRPAKPTASCFGADGEGAVLCYGSDNAGGVVLWVGEERVHLDAARVVALIEGLRREAALPPSPVVVNVQLGGPVVNADAFRAPAHNPGARVIDTAAPFAPPTSRTPR